MKLVLFYHAYIYGNNYVSIMSETFRLLVSSKLFEACDKLYIGVYEEANAQPQDGISWLKHFWSISNKVEIIQYSVNDEERSTMLHLKEYCKNNPDDYVLYFHAKGITKYNQATQDWRRYMEYFNIERWQDCVTKLNEGYDCCGVMWNSKTPQGNYPHFSGTFWWATSKYINTLQDTFLNDPNRYFREYWIGSNPNVKVYEFHNSGLNSFINLKAKKSHYQLSYPRVYYENSNIMLHIICTAYQRPIQLRMFIDSFLVQTNPNWILHIIHDGEPSDDIKKIINSYEDKRIMFEHTKNVNGNYGHSNRNLMLEMIITNSNDFVLITNEDNYYVPVFVEYMLNSVDHKPIGIVYCNTVHSFFGYTIHNSRLIERHIDCGAFIVRADIAKKVGFVGIHHSADGAYAQECKRVSDNSGLQSVKIDKPLFIHN